MKPRIIPFVILFAIATTTSGNDDNSYSALSRLHLAMQVRSFPTPIDGKIALWIQETPKSGRLPLRLRPRLTPWQIYFNERKLATSIPQSNDLSPALRITGFNLPPSKTFECRRLLLLS